MGGLADFLAGAGQVYGGYTEAEAVAQKLRNAKIAEEMAALKLDGERRLADYDRSASSGLKEFLPGGDNATTVMTPGEGAVIPNTMVDDDGNAMPQDLGQAKPVQQENRMGALEFMHKAALDAGLPDKAEAIQKRIHAYKSEGLVDTAQAILAGKSDDEIRDTFNRQGGIKLSRVQRVPGSDSTISGMTEDGKAIQFDARNMLKSTMGAKDLFAAEDRATALDAKEKDLTRRGEIADELAKARAKLWEAQGGAAVTRANAAATKAAGGGTANAAKDRAERRKFDADVSRYAKDEAKGPDGKTDPELANQIVGLSMVLVDDDPDLLANPRSAVQAAREKIAELREKAGFKAGREWDGAESGGGHDAGTFEGFTMADGTKEGKEAFVKRRTEEIIKGLMRGVRSKAQEPADSGGPKKITTNDEWAALQSGTLYIGPDGKLRRKP